MAPGFGQARCAGVMDGAPDEFEYRHDTAQVRVIFGRGSRHRLAAELDQLNARTVLLIADLPSEAVVGEVAQALGTRVVATIRDVRQHVPADQAASARRLAEQGSADAVVTLGGGSATGLAKAVALATGLPVVAVPSTYAGSELTPIWGMTQDRVKRTGRDERVRPRLVIYDPELLVDLPDHVAIPSSFNALAHCFEAIWVSSSTPIARMYALEGINWLAHGLLSIDPPGGRAAGRDRGARAWLLLHGTYFAGMAFGITGSGLHHKICHILGGRFDLPHAPTHAALLTHVAAFNADPLSSVESRLAPALRAPDIQGGLEHLYSVTGAPRWLRDVGLRREQLPEAIAVVQAGLPIDNPRPVTAQAVADLITAAFAPESEDL